MEQRTFSLEQFPYATLNGIQLKSITLRSLCGDDEKKAIQLAATEGDMKLVGEKLIMLSIAEVDGAKVDQPWLEFSKLNIKTRSLIGAAFDEVNAVKPEDTKSFLASQTIRV